jgi:hypothetical protein
MPRTPDALAGHEPLGERTVIDAVSELPVPYFNVYDGIEERMAKMRWAS